MLQEAPTAAGEVGKRVEASGNGSFGRRVWIVFADPMANRIFFECGIVERLNEALPGRLAAVFLLHEKHLQPWLPRLDGIPVLGRDEVLPTEVPIVERVLRRVDIELDKRIGFYPLAIRHSRRHGFFRDRMAPGHPAPFLDSSRIGPLPRWRFVDSSMARWHLSPWRHVPSALVQRMRRECDGVVITNPQAHMTRPLLTAARRLRLPIVGYIASWDHQVGKGIVSPHLDRYIVQNETMREDLQRYHRIEPSRVSVAGWPQTDIYHPPRTVAEYQTLLHTLGLPLVRPVVVYAGNEPDNSPYEEHLVTRLVGWWRENAKERFSLLFRPHPYDHDVGRRYATAFAEPEVAVQLHTYANYGELVTLLQHVDCVVASGGTILLEALVNDRPSVCITFAEGTPPGFDAADRTNQTGEHYRKLIESDAFYRAANFEELVARLEQALDNPSELQAERQRVSREVVGEIDGRAAERVVSVIERALMPGVSYSHAAA